MERINMFDFEKLANIDEKSKRITFIRQEIKRIGYSPLSEALMNRDNRGTDVLIEIQGFALKGFPDPETGAIMDSLGGQVFTLECLCDEFGEPVKPGDKITWKRQINNRENGDKGKKINHKKIKDRVRRLRKGDHNPWEEMSAKVIDKYGCITLNYESACQLLNNSGVYWYNDSPITGKNEVEKHPRKTSRGERTIRNWRFKEVPTPKLKEFQSKKDSQIKALAKAEKP